MWGQGQGTWKTTQGFFSHPCFLESHGCSPGGGGIPAIMRSPFRRPGGDLAPGKEGCGCRWRERGQKRRQGPAPCSPGAPWSPVHPGSPEAGAGVLEGLDSSSAPRTRPQAPHPQSAPGACACVPASPFCLAVSMATNQLREGSGSKKMKLKSLLLRYYPPGTGGCPPPSRGTRTPALGAGRVGGEAGAGTPRAAQGWKQGAPQHPHSFRSWALFLQTFIRSLLGSL